MQNLAERSSSTMNRKDGDYCLQSLSLDERRKLSAHQVALSSLEFKKQFLILSYCGKMKLEDVITVDAIKSLENLPMVLFETEHWRLLGCKCIQDADRAKNLDWNSDSTFIYHREVYPDGYYQFKGPYLQPGKTHLQRVLGNENVLVVKFAKSSGVDGNETIVKCNSSTSVFSRISKESLRGSGLNSTYHRIRREGIFVGLRRYKFFVFKDSSKNEKKKGNTDLTFSSVECYFACMKSGVSPLVELPSRLLNKSISEGMLVFY
ncbi:hypothetical protein MKW94_016822 [Papaver nudicaule]|uniref:RNA-dependent RNA polymerase n=1 Tax=Papaver nudicaule TaxID=74823 RepID=A0AA41S221_PAPNU|nr:hypothetical protein [Papaver nudicaule]